LEITVYSLWPFTSKLENITQESKAFIYVIIIIIIIIIITRAMTGQAPDMPCIQNKP
jgi:hypothetical protein